MKLFTSLAILGAAWAQQNSNSTATGACMDAADQTAYKAKGEKNFISDMTDCGKKCMGAKSCVSKCMVGKESYTSACADCFGELGACTESNCLAQCIAGNSPKCAACQQAKCAPAFTTCSGLTPPSTALLVPSQGTATCTSTPETCTGTCTIEEAAPVKGKDLHIDVSGVCATDTVTAATYDIKMVFGGLPILSKTGQDASKDNTFSLPLNMGSVEIPAIKLPIAAGTSLKLPGVAHIGKLAPNGKLVCNIAAYDQAKKGLFKIEVDISI